MSRIIPITEAPEAALALTARGIARQAPTPLLEAAAPDPHETARTVLARTLDGDERAPGWVALGDDGAPRAMLAAFVEIVDESHPAYTYMPERYALAPLSLWHAASAADLDAMDALVDRLAIELGPFGVDRLQVQTRPHDWLAGSAWRDLGLRPDVIMAGRRTARIDPGPAEVEIRIAEAADEEALIALSFEEHRFHAHETRTGTRADQALEPTVAEVRRALAQQDPPGILVACEPGSGEVRSMISLSTIELPAIAASAGFTPKRCGYIGLTSTTAAVRGRGYGRALAARAMAEFVDRGLDTVMLHYVDDNPLSRSFWDRLGFAPHITTLSGDVLAARRARPGA